MARRAGGPYLQDTATIPRFRLRHRRNDPEKKVNDSSNHFFASRILRTSKGFATQEDTSIVDGFASGDLRQSRNDGRATGWTIQAGAVGGDDSSWRSTVTLVQFPFVIHAVLCVVCTSANGSTDPRPNILFIFADDQNYKTLSCYPEAPEWVQTPNIDTLASQGIRFHRAYFGAWCMPSRASFLTGQLQHAIQSMRMEGKYPGSTYDPQQCRFWPAVFREQGYHTAQIGKWHTGVDTGYGRDWDHQIVWNRPGHPENAGNYFHDQLVTFNGVDWHVGGYSTDNYTDWAVDYIKGGSRDPEKPWYLWLCYGAVHGPTTPADRHHGQYSGMKAPVPSDIFGPWPGKAAYLRHINAWIRGEDGKAYRRKRQVTAKNFDMNTAGQSFDAWVQQMNECNLAVDEAVGRLMAALRASGQLENTLVVYSADQGFALGEHGMNNKVAPYDAAIASPLILSHLGKLPQGKVCDQPVNAPDLVRYFCDVAGVTIPWKMHGRDLQPLLRDPQTDIWDKPMLMTHTGREYGGDTDTMPTREALLEVGGIPWYVLLRDGQYKYIRYLVEGETEELYDLQADPEELTNLADRPPSPDLLESLREKAMAELRRTDAKFVDRLPATAAMR